MAAENYRPHKSDIPGETFSDLAITIENHIDFAAAQNVRTSISMQNGFHFDSKFGEHEVVDFGKQETTTAASHAKLAVVAFKLVQGKIEPDDKRDLLSMLRISDNGAFIRQKKGIAPEILEFARTELGLETDILRIRENGSSYTGLTTAKDSLKLFMKTVQLAHKNNDLQNDICEALSTNTSRYGVRAKIKPRTGIHLMNKTGDLYADDDPDIGESVHHDVGVLYTNGKSKRRLAYSITSSADSKWAAMQADWLNMKIAGSMIEAVGGTPRTPLEVAASKILPRYDRS